MVPSLLSFSGVRASDTLCFKKHSTSIDADVKPWTFVVLLSVYMSKNLFMDMEATHMVEEEALRVEATALSLPPATRDQLHLAVCDVCDALILGVRYKCVVCDDYDQCEICFESACQQELDLHPPMHVFLRLGHAVPSEDLRPNVRFPFLEEEAEGVEPYDFECFHCKEVFHVPPSTCLQCVNCEAFVCRGCELEHNEHHALLVWNRALPPTFKSFPQLPVFCHCAPRLEKTFSGRVIEVPSNIPPSDLRVQDMMIGHLDDVREIDSECFAFPWDPNTFGPLLTQYKDRITAYVALADVAAAPRSDGETEGTNSDPSSATSVVGGYTICERRGHGNEMYVMSLAIRAQFRRRGVGRLLLTHALDTAHNDDGLDTATLHVNTCNIPARRLYERLGFFPTETVNGYYKKEGDAYFMRAVLPVLRR